MRRCMIAGSFDPVTNGHRALIERAARLFDEVHVVVFVNSDKKCFFDADRRLGMLRAAIADIPGAVADKSDMLVTDYARAHGIDVLFKGVRDADDYTYEARLAAIYKELYPALETVLVTSDPGLSFLSSTFVREMLRYGRDISPYVPESVLRMIAEAREN